VKRGSADWAPLSNGLGTSVIYIGAQNRSDRVRVRRCAGGVCGPFVERGVPATDCSTLPM
jgi:hypothetical protein